MTSRWMVLCFVTCAGCPVPSNELTSAEFQAQATPLFCAKYEQCVDGFDEEGCNEGENVDVDFCSFDANAAQACIDGIPSSTCGPEEEFFLPEFPSACDQVYSGCGRDTGRRDTGDPVLSSCEFGQTVEIDGVTYEVDRTGLTILFVRPNLVASGFQPFEASTCDWTYGDNLLNIYQTGVEDLSQGWDEQHVIPSISFSEATEDTPPLDHLELAIEHVETVGELNDDARTLFNEADAGTLTYVLRVYTSDGDLADCVAWGHDVPALFAGQVPDNNPDPHFETHEISAAYCADLSR